MDIIDAACAREQLDRDRALAAHRAQQVQQASATRCIDCDDGIPEVRQKLVAGVQRCVGCQQLHERRGARYRHGLRNMGGVR